MVVMGPTGMGRILILKRPLKTGLFLGKSKIAEKQRSYSLIKDFGKTVISG